MLPNDPRHGTNAGHRAHFTAGTTPCQPCRDAHAAYRRELWRKKYLRRVPDLYIDSKGTVRRIRALQAIGWPLYRIDQELGHGDGRKHGGSNYTHNLCRQQQVHRDTAAAVSALYDRLSMTRGPSERAAAVAASRGWPPPLAWDDIDNDVHPKGGKFIDVRNKIDHNVVLRILGGDKTPARKASVAERREVVRKWPSTGRSYNDLAKLTGWRPDRYGAAS